MLIRTHVLLDCLIAQNQYRYYFRRYLTLLILLGESIFLWGQSERVLFSGQVTDSTARQPIPYASIRLLSLPDSSLIAGGSTDKDGKFYFYSSLKQEKDYLLNVFFVGYRPFNRLLPKHLHKEPLHLSHIALVEDNIHLGEAVVTAKAPLSVTVEDTTVYNASAYRTPEGSMLEELVKQLPGSEITADGKILIQGKEVKKILIDGKEFFFNDPKAALKSLPVDLIEKVKAYEQKSDLARLTGIDDGEEEMILDLSVKKDMKQGWRDNFMAGIGSKQRYEAANTYNRFRESSQLTVIGNLNNTNNQGFSELQQSSSSSSGNTRSRDGIAISRSFGINFSRDWKNVKLRSNIQYAGNNRSQIAQSTVDNFLRTIPSITKGKSDDSSSLRNLTGNAYLEWRIDSLTTLLVRPQFHTMSNRRYSDNEQQSLSNDTLVNEKTATSDNHSSQHDMGLMVQLSRKLNRKGRNVALAVNYGTNGSSSDRESYTTTQYLRTSTQKILNQHIHNRADGDNYRIQLVYVEPLFKAYFLQFRYSYLHRTTHSDRFVYNWDEANNDFYSECDTTASNSFENQYSNHLFNLSIRTNHLKYNYNVGFDWEPQRSSSYSHLDDVTKNRFTKQVYNFSPRAMFLYKFSKRTRLQITYRGNSRQPNISDLQPVVDTTNPLYIRIGNPSLKPSYTNTFMLDYHSYNVKRQRNIILSILAENTINQVTSQTTYNSETGVRTTTPVNMNGNWRAQGAFSLNSPVFSPNWIFRTYSYLQYSNQNGYTTINKEDPMKTSVQHLTAQQRLQLTYRTSSLEISLRGNLIYNNSYNNVRDQRVKTYDYNWGGNIQYYLPWGFEIYSDITNNIRLGYGYDSKNRNNIIWNGQVTKSFFKRKELLLRLKIYDILHQETSLFRSITSTAIRDTEYNALGSYCMLHVILRLNMMGKRGRKNNG